MKQSGGPITPASMQKLKFVFAKMVGVAIVVLVNNIGFANCKRVKTRVVIDLDENAAVGLLYMTKREKWRGNREHPSYPEPPDHSTPYQ